MSIINNFKYVVYFMLYMSFILYASPQSLDAEGFGCYSAEGVCNLQ